LLWQWLPLINKNAIFHKVLQTENCIGYDKAGQPINIITILTDAGGKIITAFPGKINVSCFHDSQHPVSTSI
jgi:hypothetical protein